MGTEKKIFLVNSRLSVKIRKSPRKNQKERKDTENNYYWAKFYGKTQRPDHSE